jgi:hypothetical protein
MRKIIRDLPERNKNRIQRGDDWFSDCIYRCDGKA